MTMEVKMPVALASVFIWIGFVCAISFMEAWLKFRAPGIDIKLGLGIGRIVFNALNKVEWVLTIAILINMLFAGDRFSDLKNLFIALPIVILLLQTFWLLPSLDTRAELLLQDRHIPGSSLHLFYVIAEFVKVVALWIFGIQLFKT